MDTNVVEIRLATANDLEDIEVCARDAYAVYINRMGQKPAPMVADFDRQIELNQVYVAFSGSTFVGYVVFYSEGDHIHLENVAVTPSQAGGGFGKQLIEHAEKTARDKNLVAVELYTNEAMTENLAMYPSLGYVEIGRKEQDGYKRVFFRKLTETACYTLEAMSVYVSTDKSLLDVAFIHQFLTSSYWSDSISEEIVRKSIEHSLCFGIYEKTQQIGFARVITDYCTFAYLADVFISPDQSGRGHGKWLMGYIMSYPELQRIKRWHLVTRDAQGLYKQFGFEQVANSDRHMEITNLNIFKDS